MSFARLFLAAGIAATVIGSSASANAAVSSGNIQALSPNATLLPTDGVRKAKRLRSPNNALPALVFVVLGLAVAGGAAYGIAKIVEDDEPASP